MIVKPADATKVADAIVRVFIDHGDRTNRTKARLKYVLDAMGFEKFLALVEEKLGAQARRACRPKRVAPRPAFDRAAHIGVHRAEAGRACNWIGVVLPVGKLTRGADARARRHRAAISATAISGSRSGRTC